MGSKRAPSAPDYTKAAEATATSSEEVNRAQTFANRPNQYTPWGSNTWTPNVTVDPATGERVTTWDQTVTLDPDEQAALDMQQQITRGMSEGALGLLDRAADSYGDPLDYDAIAQFGANPSLPDFYNRPELPRGQVANLPMGAYTAGGPLQEFGQTPESAGGYDPRFAEAMYGREMSLMAPEMEYEREALDTQLRNQGLRPGTEAYDRQMDRLNRQQGEQRARLSQSSVLRGAEEQQRMFGRELSAGEFQNALRSQDISQRLGVGQQLFGQQMDQAAFIDSQRAADVGERLSAGDLVFGQQMRQAEYQNALRQAQIAESMQRRGMTINEMNAMLYGNQVNMPEMPSFMGANRADATNYLGAAQARGQFDNQRYATALGPVNAAIGAAGSFGSPY